jgi:phosphoserine phosphatase
MDTVSGLARIVLDFDGTCTQIPPIFESYLELYCKGLNESGLNVTLSEWRDAQAIVREHSPKAGWTLAVCPSAPAAGDPYVLADEAARLILRRRGVATPVPPTVHARAYETALAPWREEARDTFSRLVEYGVQLHFVSNSSTTFITRRLRDLFGDGNLVTTKISVQSDAGKFRICELNWDEQGAVSVEARRRFQALPVAHGEKLLTEIERPIYLRRGAYFEAINRVLEGDFDALTNTVFCGDTWEMDLAMPYALGAKIHLLDRAAPFETYAYERQALAGCGDRGKTSADLFGLLDWL